MSDIYDQATDQEMMEREIAIKAARSRNQPIHFTGHCLYCNEAITQGRFCAAECREDYELEQKIKYLSGRK